MKKQNERSINIYAANNTHFCTVYFNGKEFNVVYHVAYARDNIAKIQDEIACIKDTQRTWYLYRLTNSKNTPLTLKNVMDDFINDFKNKKRPAKFSGVKLFNTYYAIQSA